MILIMSIKPCFFYSVVESFSSMQYAEGHKFEAPPLPLGIFDSFPLKIKCKFQLSLGVYHGVTILQLG